MLVVLLRLLRGLAPLCALSVALAVSCARTDDDTSLLQEIDRKAPVGAIFDPTNLMTNAAFSDGPAINGIQLQTFFRRTPYGRGSFLETYQSNGLRASDAILRSALRYRVNPLLLVARLQSDQGLVGTTVYPQTPSRVEYAFACGCAAPNVCEPAYAGLDRQLDCIAQTLRAGYDRVKSAGETASGWAVGRPGRTLDGVSVTPVNEATAALYDATPTMGQGKGGAWLVWALFTRYADAIGYFPPFEEPTASAWVGDACSKDADCAYDSAYCDTSTPGGNCTFDCTSAACPTKEGLASTFCAKTSTGGRCAILCVADGGTCRSGFTCEPRERSGPGDPATDTVCAAD